MGELRRFSFALIFRAADPRRRAAYRDAGAREIAAAVRGAPGEWQCLLMKRSYRGREWDTFGGAADAGETPEQTLRRELREESGFEVADLMAVGRSRRPYRGGDLHGYGFVVVPRGAGWDADDVQTAANDEVERVGYFGVRDVHDGEPYLRAFAARMRAFLAADEDADCWAYLTEAGKERCRLAGDDCPPG